MAKKIKTLLWIILLIVLFLQTPTWQWLKSITVMSVYSAYEASYSLLDDRGIQVKIPGGMSTKERDWYPFVMTFNDDYGFSRYMGDEIRMTVLYNFGHFSPWSYQSDYYELESNYYNSFYGAYAVAYKDGRPFGYIENEQGLIPDIETMVQVPSYDMKYLVLGSIGCLSPTFEYEVVESGERTLFGDEVWQYFDADMTVSGSLHRYYEDQRAYIQYGRPSKVPSGYVDYEPVLMRGRIYSRYLETYDMTLFLYCIAMDESVIEAWEEEYMENTEIIYGERE